MVVQITPFEALQKAVEIIGSQHKLARLCGVSSTAVWKWLQSSKRVPPTYVLRVEAATGISRHLLNPEIYPIENHSASAQFEPVLECGPALSRRDIPRQSNRRQVLDARSVA